MQRELDQFGSDIFGRIAEQQLCIEQGRGRGSVGDMTGIALDHPFAAMIHQPIGLQATGIVEPQRVRVRCLVALATLPHTLCPHEVKVEQLLVGIGWHPCIPIRGRSKF